MAVSYLSIFLTAFIGGLIWFFLLSCGCMLLIKLSEFRKPSVSTLSKAYLIRYLIGSVLAGLTAIYIYARNDGANQQHAWVAVILSLGLWSVLLLILELLAVKAED